MKEWLTGFTVIVLGIMLMLVMNWLLASVARLVAPRLPEQVKWVAMDVIGWLLIIVIIGAILFAPWIIGNDILNGRK